jgi:YVTN family beta-propeller protein
MGTVYRAAGLAGALVLSLSLAGCAGGGGGQPAASSTASGPATTDGPAVGAPTATPRAASANWHVASTIHVGIKPFYAAGGFGDLWVVNADEGSVSRISPTTNTVTATIDLRAGRPDPESEGLFGIALTDDRVWVTCVVLDVDGNALPGFLWVIDPVTNKAVASEAVGAFPWAIASAFGSLWIANLDDGTVSRMDPGSRRVVATIPVGGSPIAIAAGPDAVWVANQADGTVSRIDPVTNRVVTKITVGDELAAIAVGDHRVWVASKEAIAHLDPVANTVVGTVKIGGVAGLVADGGTIWAAESLGLRVHEIDEASATIRNSLTLATNSWGITVFAGSVWAVHPAAADKKWADRAPGEITRIDP